MVCPTLISQLIEIYFNHRDWDKKKLKLKDILDYYIEILMKDKLITYSYNRQVIGFIEYWKVNDSQIERIKSNKDFFIADENINDGDICYIADLYINKDYRKLGIMKYLKNQVIKKCIDCKYFCGKEIKNHQRWRIYHGRY